MGHKIGILGLGSIGLRHLDNIVNNIPDVEEILVFDLDSSKTERTSSYEKVRACKNTEHFSDPALDLVLICTPNASHFADSNHFIKAGIPVFIEKPVTVNYKECLELSDSSTTHIFVGCNMRYHPAIKKAKELIDSKAIGEIVSARAFFGHLLKNWRPDTDYKASYSAKEAAGGGVIWDGIHELDYITWLLGSVTKYTSMYVNTGILDIETEEIAEIILKHEDLVLSSIHLDYIQPVKRRGLELVGSEGTYIWNSTGKNPENMTIRILRGTDTVEELYNNVFNDVNAMYVEEMKEIFSVLDGKPINATSLVTINEACREIEIIENIKNKKSS